MACQYLDGFTQVHTNWKTRIRASMPMCLLLSVGLVIYMVLYPYSSHTLQEINCSPLNDKNAMISVRIRALEDPEVEKLENVLAEGLPQSNVSPLPLQLPLSSYCTQYHWKLLLGLMYILSYLQVAFLQSKIH